MNEEMLLRLINDNTIAQDRVCQALENVGDLLERSATAQEVLNDGLIKLLGQFENKNKDRFRLSTDIAPDG